MTTEDRLDPLKSAIAKCSYSNHRDLYYGYLTPVEILALFKAGVTDYYGHKGKRSDHYVCAMMRKKMGIGGLHNFYFHPNGLKMRGKDEKYKRQL